MKPFLSTSAAVALGHDIESVRVAPVRAAQELKVRKRVGRAVRQFNQLSQRDICCREPAARLKQEAARSFAGFVDLDGYDLKCRAQRVHGPRLGFHRDMASSSNGAMVGAAGAVEHPLVTERIVVAVAEVAYAEEADWQ
jgi:hypothetical protein